MKKNRIDLYGQEDNGIADAQVYSDLQQDATWKQEGKVALFNALGPLHPCTIDATLRLAAAKAELEEYLPALEYVKEAYASRVKVFGKYHKLTIQAYLQLATAYLDAGFPKEALAIAKDVLRDDFPNSDEDFFVILSAKIILADALQQMDKIEQEIQVREDIVKDVEDLYGENHPDTMDSVERLAIAYDDNNQIDKAIELYQRICDYMETNGDSEGYVMALANLAVCNYDLGKKADALRFAEKSLSLSRELFGDDDDLTKSAKIVMSEVTEDPRFSTT